MLTFAAPAVELTGSSEAIQRVLAVVRRAAEMSGGVLITAEPGVAAESVACELHARGPRQSAPFVLVPCAAAEPSRLEAFLFGTASADAPSDLEVVTADSRIAAAREGTLFLQDVSELPAAAQARLARIARDGEVRIGGAPVATAFRLIASAAPGIDADVHAQRFRADLYRRLSTVRIDLPSLRDRSDDVPVLAERLLEEACEASGVRPRTFTQAALALVCAVPWPGNVAQMREVIARAVRAASDDVIQIEHLLPALQLQRAPAAFRPAGNLREARQRFEREYIAAVLQHHGWRMADAAHTLGIQRPNLYRKARQLGIPLTRMSD